MAIQLKRTSTTPTTEQLSSLLEGQPLVNLETGDMYVGGCCDGRPVNASNILNGAGKDSLMQYGGTQDASAGSPAAGYKGNSADGKYAVALGRYVHSRVRNTITLGYTSVNDSEYGTVIGRGNYSIGDNSVVIGKYNNNNGADNYIIGTFNNLDNVDSCYLFGHGLTAIRGNNFVIGSNNDSSHNNGHDIFQIGDGWGSGAAETKDEKFNLVTVLKRVRDSEGQYSYGGYMEITIQGNTPNSVIKKSTMDTAIGIIDTKIDELEKDLSAQLELEKTARESVDTTLQEEIGEVDSKVEQHKNEYIEFLQTYLQTVYPVGSIYMTADSTNPHDRFGFGTWEQLKDRFLLGAGDTYTNGQTDGSSTVTLTTANLPTHHHLERLCTGSEQGTGDSTGYYYPATRSTMSTAGAYITTSSITEMDSAQPVTPIYTGDTGSNMAHNNMPPYLVVYMWKRIA